jgi:parallel beta helix pectate lyase-like protein
MRNLRVCLVALCVLVPATAAFSDDTLDCGKKSLADAVQNVTAKNLTINFTGVCTGPIVITTDGVTLKGVGAAIIDGDGADAITIVGASNVSLIDLEVTNGSNGIVIRDGSHVAFTGVNVHDNTGSGIRLQAASSAVYTGIVVTHNAQVGLLADNGVNIRMTSSTITGNTAKDIQLTFGTIADLTQLTFGTYTCDATVLVRGTAAIVCPH